MNNTNLASKLFYNKVLDRNRERNMVFCEQGFENLSAYGN